MSVSTSYERPKIRVVVNGDVFVFDVPTAIELAERLIALVSDATTTRDLCLQSAKTLRDTADRLDPRSGLARALESDKSFLGDCSTGPVNIPASKRTMVTERDIYGCPRDKYVREEEPMP